MAKKKPAKIAGTVWNNYGRVSPRSSSQKGSKENLRKALTRIGWNVGEKDEGNTSGGLVARKGGKGGNSKIKSAISTVKKRQAGVRRSKVSKPSTSVMSLIGGYGRSRDYDKDDK